MYLIKNILCNILYISVNWSKVVTRLRYLFSAVYKFMYNQQIINTRIALLVGKVLVKYMLVSMLID